MNNVCKEKENGSKGKEQKNKSRKGERKQKKEKERKGLNEGTQAIKEIVGWKGKQAQRKGSMGIRGRERNPWKETKRKQKERKISTKGLIKNFFIK